MHWTLACTGTLDGVRAYVRDAVACCPKATNTFDRARAMLLTELAGVETNGATVEAEGEAGHVAALRVTALALVLHTTPRDRETSDTPALGSLRFAEGAVRMADFGGEDARVRPAHAARRP